MNPEECNCQSFILELVKANGISTAGSVALVGPSDGAIIRIVHFKKFNTAGVVSQSVALPGWKEKQDQSPFHGKRQIKNKSSKEERR